MDDDSSLSAEVQLALREEGYYRGPVDEVLGDSAREAIRRYQTDHRLPVTGRISVTLLQSLGIM